jgi:CBS domain-containing protein
MFTLHDLIPRVVLTDISLDAPIARAMTPEPLNLPPDACAYEAALLMAREGIGHVCVVESGKLLGVVSERDLFSLQRVGLVHLSRAITSAVDVDTLSRLSRDVHQLIDQMLAQGVAVEQLTQIITLLNDHLTRRVIHLCCAECAAPPPRFTWLALGSEGRQEQTLKTDQDNGMLFVPGQGMTAEETRTALLPLAQQINAALATVGFPLCEGQIMAGNPQWCLSEAEWKEKFADWIHRADAPVLLNATIFFDFRTLYGDPEPVHELRTWLHERIKDNRLFLRSLSENALANRPPLGLVRDFVTEHGDDHADTLDLKINGITPFVDAARIFALAAGIDTTATVGRLRAAARVWHLDSAEVDAWVEAFWFMQLLRLRLQFEQRQKGLPLSNRIDPNALNDLDRRILKEAFRQARKLQTKFEYWFLV